MKTIGTLLWAFWSFSLVFAGEYYIPLEGDDLIGRSYVINVKKGDSLTTLRQEHDVSYDELLEANPKIDFYKLKIGQRIIIPKQFILPKFRTGIVINIPELRMYYFDPDSGKVYTFTVGLGREDWRTPVGIAKVINKKENPCWTVPTSIRNYVYEKTGKILPKVVAPGPDNPLGKHAIYLSMAGSYHIHGTNAPTSVGAFISSGCVRMLREPIEFLYNNVQVGTEVHIIHHPYKTGWHNGKLYLESHKPIKYYSQNVSSDLDSSDVETVVKSAAKIRPTSVNWKLVFKNVEEHLGIPEVVGY